jgi:hypothetical protein
MSRYSPGVKSESNPLDKGSLGPVTKIDSIVGAEAIQKIEFDSIISLLKSTRWVQLIILCWNHVRIIFTSYVYHIHIIFYVL